MLTKHRRSMSMCIALVAAVFLFNAAAVAMPADNFPVIVSVKVLKQALEEAKKIGSLDKRVDRYIEIAGKFIEINEAVEVEGILSLALHEAHKMSPGRKKVSVFSDIADRFSAIKKKDQAEGLLDQALLLTDQINSKKTRIEARLNVNRQYSLMGKKVKVLGLSSQIIYEASKMPVSCYKAKIYADVASSFVTAGMLNRAKGMLKQSVYLAKCGGNESKVLNFIALTYASAGEYETAIRIAEKIGSEDVKVKTLADISSKMMN